MLRVFIFSTTFHVQKFGKSYIELDKKILVNGFAELKGISKITCHNCFPDKLCGCGIRIPNTGAAVSTHRKHNAEYFIPRIALFRAVIEAGCCAVFTDLEMVVTRG